MKYAYLLLVGMSALGGCVPNDISFTIDRFVAMDSSTMCVASPTATAGVAQGLLDVGVAALSEGYILAPVVGNHLIEVASTTVPEQNAIFVTGFDVKLKPDATIAGSIPSAQLAFFVPSAGGRVVPGAEVAAPVEVVPKAIANELTGVVSTGLDAVRPLIIASVRPVGQRNGSDMTGNWLDVPIQLCNFCLSQPTAPCPATGFKMGTVLLGGCFPQQDQPTTCCTQNNQILCGNQVPMSTAP